jgi:hypothetical protein
MEMSSRSRFATLLVLVFSPPARAWEPTAVVLTANADCAVSIDGQGVAALKANGTDRVDLEPGEHLVTAECKGRRPWKQVIQVGAQQKVVDIQTVAAEQGTPALAPAMPPGLGPADSGSAACPVSGIPIEVCHYVGGFAASNCCRGTLMYDETRVRFTPSGGFHAGARLAALCSAVCLETTSITEIGENAFFGSDVGAFHVKSGGTSHDFAPVDFLGKPQKVRTKGMVKYLKEKTSK